MTSKNYTGGEPFGGGVKYARLSDPALIELLQAYKRRVASSYRSLPPSKLGELSASNMWVSRKFDGETWFLVNKGKEVFLASPSGSVIAGKLPVLTEAKSLPDNSILAGELYAKVSGRRERVGDLASALAQDGKNADDNLMYVAFDSLQIAGQPVPIAYDEKLKQITQLVSDGSHFNVVEVTALHTGLEVHERFTADVLNGSSEGLVVHHANGIVYKVKPEINIDAVVIGYTVKADEPKACRSILLGLITKEGSYAVVGACGNIGSNADRLDWFKRLSKLNTESRVRRASDSGGLYQFVKPEIVAQFVVTDLQGELSDGSIPVVSTVGYSNDEWTLVGSVQSPSLLHPVFERIREDKKINETDVRFAQVEEYLPSGRVTIVASGPLPTSTVLRREVWTKTTKGQLAVRKLLVWKTNKSKVNSLYPEFVVHWTDYSAGRASPLDREVRPAPDEVQAMKLAEELIEANIKKGWEKVS